MIDSPYEIIGNANKRISFINFYFLVTYKSLCPIFYHQVEAEYFQRVMNQLSEQKTVFVSLLRVWWGVFLALQLDGTVQWDWGLVFLPVWLYLFLQYLYAISFRKW